MFTAAEMIQMTRDDIADQLADYVHDSGLTDAQIDEIIEIGIDIALDETDAETVDGEWVDCTPYEDCARRARKQWEDAKRAEHDERGDCLYHRSIDA